MSNPFTYANKVRKKFKDPYWVAKNKYITYYEQLPIDEKVILLDRRPLQRSAVTCSIF